MIRSALYLRIIGLCLVAAVARQYSLIVYTTEAVSGLIANDAGLGVILFGLGHLMWWLITLAGGIALLIPHRIGKWLLLASLAFGLVLGAFVSWLPGADHIGELIQSPYVALAVFYLINAAILVGVFVLSARASAETP